MEQLSWKKLPGVRGWGEGAGGGDVQSRTHKLRRRASPTAGNMNIDRVTELSTGGGGVGGGGGGTIATTTTRTAREGAVAEQEQGGGGGGGGGGSGAIYAEWSGSHGALAAEVELRLHPSPARPALSTASGVTTTVPTSLGDGNGYNVTRNDTDRGGGGGGSGGGVRSSGGGVVVRAEEALIVTFVLLLWVAAIALFINRWGKIRMLEPYQPKFQQQHRASCPASIGPDPAQPPPPPTPHTAATLATHHRLSLSHGCSSCGDYTLMLGGGCRQTCLYLAQRPRQNSVFAGSSGAMALISESPARRSHSAADIRALLLPRQPSTSRQRYLAVTDV